ncbi:MAG TPA: hypothetical protein VK705_07375 [Ferruginibacter sp.]|jgi:hypothetical protein|nr:hypothetical protein [Ferruginibacter sp.]
MRRVKEMLEMPDGKLIPINKLTRENKKEVRKANLPLPVYLEIIERIKECTPEGETTVIANTISGKLRPKFSEGFDLDKFVPYIWQYGEDVWDIPD